MVVVNNCQCIGTPLQENYSHWFFVLRRRVISFLSGFPGQAYRECSEIPSCGVVGEGAILRVLNCPKQGDQKVSIVREIRKINKIIIVHCLSRNGRLILDPYLPFLGSFRHRPR